MSAQTVSILDLPHGPDLLTATPTWSGVNRTSQIGLVERDELTWAQADERTRTIAVHLKALRAASQDVTDLVNTVYELLEQAWAMRADQALGYDTWEAYCADRFGDLGAIRLPAAERMRVVMALTGVEVDAPRLTGRGAARIMAVDEQTVRADRKKATLALVPAPATDVVESVVMATNPDESLPRSVALLVMDALADAGPRGLTIPEAVKRLKRSYGSVSGALHALEAQGHATRPDDMDQRGTYRPYVAAGHLP